MNFYPDEDSTATIRVFGLPVDEGAEAFLRSCVNTLKAHGPRTRPQLRADLASALLRGHPTNPLTASGTPHATDMAAVTGAAGVVAEHVKIRDGTCRFPNCRIPAKARRADHTTNHADGGPTCVCNAGTLCAHHDQLKQSGTWQLRQPQQGHFHWNDPRGRDYAVDPPKLTDPDPPPF